MAERESVELTRGTRVSGIHHEAGESVEVDPGQARWLRSQGYAQGSYEEIESPGVLKLHEAYEEHTEDVGETDPENFEWDNELGEGAVEIGDDGKPSETGGGGGGGGGASGAGGGGGKGGGRRSAKSGESQPTSTAT